jgi:DNA-binding response OmpR family regulator
MCTSTILALSHTNPQTISCDIDMTQTKLGSSHRVLLVDDDEAVRDMMTVSLRHKGFQVVAASTVTAALKLIATESFDVLITDLHMPNPSDGFTVVSAMRHSQPSALTLLVSGYPDVQSAMSAILLEADEIIVKPFETAKLVDLLREKMLTRKPAVRAQKEGVAAILERCTGEVIIDWLAKVKKSKDLTRISLGDQERTGYLRKLIEDLIVRLRSPNVPGEESDSICSAAAVAHGKMRKLQGYTPAMLVHDSRILQVTLFGTLQKNLSALDFSLLLPDVMTIADEVDSQLTQAMEGYMGVVREPVAA